MTSMPAMSKAKSRMLLHHAFFASLILSTKLTASTDGPTAWTDMRQIWYNPDFIESLDSDTVQFVLAHEVMHIALKHGLRMQGRNHKRWNIAADFAINALLKKCGFTLWKHCCYDTKYDGMSAEQIYELLKEEEREGGGGGPGGSSGGGSKGSGRGDQGGMSGDLIEPGNLDPEARAEIERGIGQKVAQAHIMGKLAGKLPAELDRLIGTILHPPMPWQQLLREFMTHNTRDTESWSHRNRRHQDVYLPAMWNPAMGEVVVIVDTSGSIGDDDLAQVASEINEIAELVKPERIRVVYVDAAVAGEEVFEQGDPVGLNAKGGGGTDMRVGLKHVEQFDPIVTVMITDGYTPWPSEEPPFPLIVVCTTGQPCPVGQAVRMNP